MKLPSGRLVRSRVVSDPRTLLVDALDRELTGYAVLEPQGSLLLDDDGRGVVTFRVGAPVAAYHTGTERGGPPALADLAASGPFRLELFALEATALDRLDDATDLRVPPGMPAERLAGDQDLADRTREHAPQTVTASTPSGEGDTPDERERDVGAVEAFLDDDEKIEAIREQARSEAAQRADEWGFETVQ